MRRLLPILLVLLLIGCAEPTQQPPLVSVPTEKVHYESYNRLLRKYVVGGRVRYGAWKASAEDVKALADFLEQTNSVRPESLSTDEQKAFWINLYNALTLHAVLERYPVKSVNIKAYQELAVAMFWDTPYGVAGGRHSLNQIEHDILRPRYNDPRIHFAINCASKGCPALLSTAWSPEDLGKQLDEATKNYLQSPAGLVMEGGKVKLSEIFKWYAEDFGDVAAFISRYRPEARADRYDYLEYDWDLNELKEEETR